MDIFHLSKKFPVEEKYGLTSQMRRSSRSVCVNMGEGYRKRIYPKHFISKLSDSDSENSETLIHLDFARDCNYIDAKNYEDLYGRCIEVGKILNYMIENPEKFLPRKN
jgi:four helix bundle protein